jgi:hypothetical protein
MNWSGHWHGYGPWTGPPETYAKEGGRRPAHPNGPPAVLDPGDRRQQAVLDRYREAAAEFTAGPLPPTMTGHWLMKTGQVSADRTWTDVSIALAWLEKSYQAAPPFDRSDGKAAYVGLNVKLAYASDVLPRGVDVSWAYYVPTKNLTAFAVVCCRNRHHPDVPCPSRPPT